MIESASIQGRFGSIVATVFFIVAGIVALYDTLSYSDSDSQVFPQTVAIALILFSSLSLAIQFLKPSVSNGFGSGIWWRRVLLVLAMLIACAVMPYAGFLPAGVFAFIGGLIAAMHDSWTPKSVVIYCFAGLVIVFAFFALFKFALHVPLP